VSFLRKRKCISHAKRFTAKAYPKTNRALWISHRRGHALVLGKYAPISWLPDFRMFAAGNKTSNRWLSAPTALKRLLLLLGAYPKPKSGASGFALTLFKQPKDC
jgi:hypothetical protein